MLSRQPSGAELDSLSLARNSSRTPDMKVTLDEGLSAVHHRLNVELIRRVKTPVSHLKGQTARMSGTPTTTTIMESGRPSRA
jgi:hypothetical protein